MGKMNVKPPIGTPMNRVQHEYIYAVLNEVHEERIAQHLKWGEQDLEPAEFMCVLTEEVGEVAQEINELLQLSQRIVPVDEAVLDEIDTRFRNMRDELVQVAAVAVQFIEAIDRQTP